MILLLGKTGRAFTPNIEPGSANEIRWAGYSNPAAGYLVDKAGIRQRLRLRRLADTLTKRINDSDRQVRAKIPDVRLKKDISPRLDI